MEFHTPPGLVGTQSRYGDAVAERTWPIFRDTNELPTAVNLSEEIKDALNQSDVLLSLCSPRAAKSRYVGQEIAYFKAKGRGKRIVAVIVGGEPNAALRVMPAIECFPETLVHRVNAEGRIDHATRDGPIAADVRDLDAKVEIDQSAFEAQHVRLAIELKRIAAGMIGVPLRCLVDWEAMARKEKSTHLRAEAVGRLDDASRLPVSRKRFEVLECLLSAEALLILVALWTSFRNMAIQDMPPVSRGPI